MLFIRKIPTFHNLSSRKSLQIPEILNLKNPTSEATTSEATVSEAIVASLPRSSPCSSPSIQHLSTPYIRPGRHT